MIKSLLFLSALGLVYGDRVPHPDCPPHGTYHLPHEYDCGRFYYCDEGYKLLQAHNCVSGLHFSVTLQRCEWPDIANCNLTESPAPTEPAPTEPAPTEPAPTEPAPTEPAPTEPAPTEPAPTEPAPTEPAPTEPAPTEPTPTEPAPTEPAPTEPAPTEPAPTEPAPTEPAPQPTEDPSNDECEGDDCEEKSCEDLKCEEDCHVLPFPHDDCDKFWMCYGNKAQLVVCPTGLYFNPSTHTCDFECNVNCDSLKTRVTEHYDGMTVYIPRYKLDHKVDQLVELIKH